MILVIIVVTVISLTAAQRANNGKANIVQSAVNDGVGIVDKMFSAPAKAVASSLASLTNLFNTYDENQQLKEKIDSYNELAIQNENYQKEIDSLKEEIGLNETLTTYEKVTANVISRSPDTWQDIMIVDKGSNAGIEVNMAVLSQKGLIGRVIEVNGFSSKVELLTTKNQNSNHFPIRVSTDSGDSYGLLKEYDDKEKALVATQLTGDSEIKVGAVVQTSGLGGNSPADLPVGIVEKVEPDKYGLDREVYVKPYADMYDIKFVTIIQRAAGGNE
nr:rod shape-determining protein MreC [Enterococcus sp. BWB1-3]